MKLIQFGAGNIGRSFIGQLFSRSGWDVVFADVNETLVSLLNHGRFYRVVIKRDGRADEIRRVGPVRAINCADREALSAEIADADLIATSVGKGALPAVLPLIAGGLEERYRRFPDRPLNIIIAENARGADGLFKATLSEALGPEYPFDTLVGLVETSIGKMVPIMRREDLAEHPLQVFAEEYEDLIVDRRAFLGPLPAVQGFCPVDNINAYVDRKLFIHNLGHAAAAYIGYRKVPEKTLIAEVLGLPELEAAVRRVMNEAADALAAEYPDAYSRAGLGEHIDDLIRRFANRALGDTVHRVGRDLYRKLGRDDRIVGAMLLCARRGLSFNEIAGVYQAALGFAAPDEQGNLFPADARFHEERAALSVEGILRQISGLDESRQNDRAVLEILRPCLDKKALLF